jgi:hypothetical protein
MPLSPKDERVMALISAYDEEPRKHNIYADARYQRFLATPRVHGRGEPGGPVEDPEPFIPVGESELVDGIPPAPEPEKPKRKRKPARKADMPARDRDAVNLARYARKLRGEP